MDRMIYMAMSGAKETLISQASNSHNLANANTTGFLADLEQFRNIPVYGDGHPTRVYSMAEQPGVDFGHGAVVRTGRDLDVAVNGDGWFAVQGKDGNEAYTRRGDLRVDNNGLLVTGNGLPLMGDNGPIAIPPSENLEIAPDGTISIRPMGQSATELAVIDRIKMVKLPGAELRKGEDGLMRVQNETGPRAADASVQLSSGALESSNVNIVDSMVEMIGLSRRFELQVKMMKQASDSEEQLSTILRMG